MNESQVGLIAIAVSLFGFVGQLVNAWLHQRVRAELAEMKGEIIERADKRYVLCEVCSIRHSVSARPTNEAA